jgi:hypothetical protein
MMGEQHAAARAGRAELAGWVLLGKMSNALRNYATHIM